MIYLINKLLSRIRATSQKNSSSSEVVSDKLKKLRKGSSAARPSKAGSALTKSPSKEETKPELEPDSTPTDEEKKKDKKQKKGSFGFLKKNKKVEHKRQEEEERQRKEEEERKRKEEEEQERLKSEEEQIKLKEEQERLKLEEEERRHKEEQERLRREEEERRLKQEQERLHSTPSQPNQSQPAPAKPQQVENRPAAPTADSLLQRQKRILDALAALNNRMDSLEAKIQSQPKQLQPHATTAQIRKQVAPQETNLKYFVGCGTSITLLYLRDRVNTSDTEFAALSDAAMLKSSVGHFLDTVVNIARFLCRHAPTCSLFYEGGRNVSELAVLDSLLDQCSTFRKADPVARNSILQQLDQHLEEHKLTFLATNNQLSIADLCLYEVLVESAFQNHVQGLRAMNQWFANVQNLLKSIAAPQPAPKKETPKEEGSQMVEYVNRVTRDFGITEDQAVSIWNKFSADLDKVRSSPRVPSEIVAKVAPQQPRIKTAPPKKNTQAPQKKEAKPKPEKPAKQTQNVQPLAAAPPLENDQLVWVQVNTVAGTETWQVKKSVAQSSGLPIVSKPSTPVPQSPATATQSYHHDESQGFVIHLTSDNCSLYQEIDTVVGKQVWQTVPATKRQVTVPSVSQLAIVEPEQQALKPFTLVTPSLGNKVEYYLALQPLPSHVIKEKSAQPQQTEQPAQVKPQQKQPIEPTQEEQIVVAPPKDAPAPSLGNKVEYYLALHNTIKPSPAPTKEEHVAVTTYPVEQVKPQVL